MPSNLPGLSDNHAVPVPLDPWSKRWQVTIGDLQVAGRHLPRLDVALELVTNLLTLYDFAHSGAFDGRDVNERVRAARSPSWSWTILLCQWS